MGIVAGLGLAVSAYGAMKSKGKRSSSAQDLAAGMSADQWQTYKNIYLPRQTDLLSRAFSQRTSAAAESARAGAEANQAADNAAEITGRQARKAGINLNSPAYADLLLKQQQNRAGMVAGAKTGGRRAADEINFRRQSAALQMGQNLPGLAAQNNATAGQLEMQQDAINAESDQAMGQIYGQAGAYLGSGLADYLRGTKTEPSSAGSSATRSPGVVRRANL